MQLHKGFLLHRPQQHGRSVTMDGSAARGSGTAVHGADIAFLPCPACRTLLPAPERSFPFHCIPRSCSNTTTLCFLWGFLKVSSNFLSPITQHRPCNHTSNIYFSARCLSNTSRLTQQRLYSPMAAVKMTVQHVETGFLCMSCESEYGYQSCQPLHELGSA